MSDYVVIWHEPNQVSTYVEDEHGNLIPCTPDSASIRVVEHGV